MNTSSTPFFPYSVSCFCVGILVPLMFWIAFTPWSAELDLATSAHFYQNGSFSPHPFWDWLYVYGLWPAWILTGLALLGFILSFFKSYRKWRAPCAYLLLVFTIGIELVVHLTLKDHWGRPRPKQTIEFGGDQPFRPYYQPNFFHQPTPSKSFPCGHATMGFYFFALGILGVIYRSRSLFWLGMAIAVILGILLSIGRIAQGGHFLSDTLAAALIMWLMAWVFAYLIFKKRVSTS